MFLIQVLASPEDERRRELMVRFDVIPGDSVALIALHYFLNSESAQIATKRANCNKAKQKYRRSKGQ